MRIATPEPVWNCYYQEFVQNILDDADGEEFQYSWEKWPTKPSPSEMRERAVLVKELDLVRKMFPDAHDVTDTLLRKAILAELFPRT